MLGREGCVTTIVTILNSVPKTHHAKIKFIMEILALLTKTSELSYCSCLDWFMSKLYLLSFIDSKVGIILCIVVSYGTSHKLYSRMCHDGLIITKNILNNLWEKLPVANTGSVHPHFTKYSSNRWYNTDNIYFYKRMCLKSKFHTFFCYSSYSTVYYNNWLQRKCWKVCVCVRASRWLAGKWLHWKLWHFTVHRSTMIFCYVFSFCAHIFHLCHAIFSSTWN